MFARIFPPTLLKLLSLSFLVAWPGHFGVKLWTRSFPTLMRRSLSSVCRFNDLVQTRTSCSLYRPSLSPFDGNVDPPKQDIFFHYRLGDGLGLCGSVLVYKEKC